MSAALMLAASGAAAQDNIFKGADFLMWDKPNQAFYIEASVGMASLIAAQRDKSQSKCIDDWYYADEIAGNDFILNIMRDYPSYHPRGIILGVLQKKCGGF